MNPYKVISADVHIVEPPDTYEKYFPSSVRKLVPRLERRQLDDGRFYDVWCVDGKRYGVSMGNFFNAGKRYTGDLDTMDYIGTWDDVPPGAYDPHAMLKDLETDGVWGALVQTGQGVFWYRLEDSELLSSICHAHNTWLSEFCSASKDRLKGVATLNADDVDVACEELGRCAKLGLSAAFIPVTPLADRPYGHPRYEPLWQTAQDLAMPLILHIATQRANVAGCEMSSSNMLDWTAAGRSVSDNWVRYSLAALIFAGVFDRFPKLRVGSIENELGWVPFWLNQMDWIYRERKNIFLRGWKSKDGMEPSEFFRRNSFVTFMEDEIGFELRHRIGVDSIMWGNDYPHAESTWPKSREKLDSLFGAVASEERKKMTSTNAARIFKFAV